MRRDVVVIGGSAGAMEPLKEIVARLPLDLPAAVVVVIHLSTTARTALGAILNRLGGMHVVKPRDGDPLRPGFVYVPTTNHHLELTSDTIRLTHGPRVNGSRPSIDVLFRSAAAAFGHRVVGVVLSGGLDDGSMGLAAIRAAGGIGIVQSPDDALVDSMPRHALEVDDPEHVVPGEEIADVIRSVIGEPAAAAARAETGGLEMEPVGAHDTQGQVTGLTCRDCHGSIWLNGEGGEVTFRCRIGHEYGPTSFFEIQAENVENALWAGVRSLEEQASLAGVMASRAGRAGDEEARGRYEWRRRFADSSAEVLRNLILERSDA